MNAGRSRIDLQGLIDFRRNLRTRVQQVTEQESRTRRALDVVSRSWSDDNFRDFEAEFSRDMARIEALVEELNRFDNPVLRNFQEKVEAYLGINYRR